MLGLFWYFSFHVLLFEKLFELWNSFGWYETGICYSTWKYLVLLILCLSLVRGSHFKICWSNNTWWLKLIVNVVTSSYTTFMTLFQLCMLKGFLLPSCVSDSKHLPIFTYLIHHKFLFLFRLFCRVTTQVHIAFLFQGFEDRFQRDANLSASAICPSLVKVSSLPLTCKSTLFVLRDHC